MLLSPWNGIKYLSIGFHGGDRTINVSFTPQPLTLNRTYSAKGKSYYTVQVLEYQMRTHTERERESKFA